MDTLIPQLLDFGALGMFAGFLIWLNARSQKRLDRRPLLVQVGRFSFRIGGMLDKRDIG